MYYDSVGVFNISLFVTLDILYDMRNHVDKGEPPGNCTGNAQELLPQRQ